MRVTRLVLLGFLALSAACGDNSTSSSPTTPTQTPANPTITERYVGTLPVGGSGFYSFSVSQYGTVNVTLNSLSVDDASVTVGMGLGSPVGFGCNTATTVTTGPGSAAQLTGPYQVGVYCVRVYDVGTLTGPTTFDVSIAHP